MYWNTSLSYIWYHHMHHDLYYIAIYQLRGERSMQRWRISLPRGILLATDDADIVLLFTLNTDTSTISLGTSSLHSKSACSEYQSTKVSAHVMTHH